MITEKDLIKQLKAFKIENDTQSKDRILNVLMAQINSNPVQANKGVFSMFPYLVSPRLVYAVGILAVVVTGAFSALASQNAMPGDTLYGAKLAVEKAQVRLTSNPAARARVQMEFAGNRLQEAKNITKDGTATGKVDEALSRFAQEVGEATKTLKQASDPVQVKQATTEIAKKANEYKQELGVFAEEQPVEQYKPGREVKFASLEQVEKALDQASEEEEVLPEGEVGL